MIQQTFWNSHERRLRSFWRILITGLMAFICVMVYGIAIQIVAGRRLIVMLASGPVVLGIVLASISLGARYLDHRKVADFGLHWNGRWLADLVFGLALGLALLNGIIAIELAVGWAYLADEVTRLFPKESLALERLTLVLLILCVGIYEELAFRGYVLKNLAEGWNCRAIGSMNAVLAAAIATSLAFGVVHGINPNASSISVGNTVLAGLLMSLGLMLTGELAIPIGFHITWNLAQCVIFGLPVSGMKLGGGLFALQTSGPKWLTGGDYGPEGGLLCTFALLLGMMLTAAWVRLSKRRLLVHARLAQAPTNAVISDDVSIIGNEQPPSDL